LICFSDGPEADGYGRRFREAPVAAYVQLGYAQQAGEPNRARLVDEVVVEVIEGCRRRGAPADPAVVRILVEREWAGFADARVQTFLPVLIGRAVSDHLSTGRQQDSPQRRHGQDG
jgi:hypothetical protein